tara:strand:+ start:10192 stop:10299 length:108 start_codon:yes stop_codon:yes gene_type:complete
MKKNLLISYIISLGIGDVLSIAHNKYLKGVKGVDI